MARCCSCGPLRAPDSTARVRETQRRRNSPSPWYTTPAPRGSPADGGIVRKHGIAVKTGFNALDKKLKGLQGQDLVVFAGRPSMGKTALALNIAANVTLLEKDPPAVAIFSLELSRNAAMTRLIASEARVNLHEVRNGFFRRERWTDLTNAASRLSEAPLFIDDASKLTAAQIASRCKRLSGELRAKGKRLGVVIIDYLQLISGAQPLYPGASGKAAVKGANIMSQLKAMAGALDVPVIVLSQIQRAKDGRKAHRPTLEDFGNPAIHQQADVVAFLFRKSYYARTEAKAAKMAEIIVAKNPRGRTGTVALRFSEELASFAA